MTPHRAMTAAPRLTVAQIDADLAERLGPELGETTLAAHRLPPGPWAGPSEGIGVLIARGLIAHATILSSQRSVVMAWQGDVITPASTVPGWLADGMTWEVVEPTVVAVLDGAFAKAIGTAGPEAVTAVAERISRMTARALAAVALSQAARVEDRLLALLLTIAEERGRVTADGICVRAFLTHERLGELIGAARPTVSLAFARLRERELVTQRSGEWLISPDAVAALVSPEPPRASDVPGVVEQSRAVLAQARQAVHRSREVRGQVRDGRT